MPNSRRLLAIGEGVCFVIFCIYITMRTLKALLVFELGLFDFLQQTACLVVNPIKVNNFAFLFNLQLHAGGSDFRLYDGSDLKTYLLMRW